MSPLARMSIPSISRGEFTTSFGGGSTTVGYVIWDGVDGLPGHGSIDFTGLGGVDLTVGATLDGLLLRVTSTDVPGTVNVTVYSDGGNFSTISFGVPGGIGVATDYFLPFASFGVGGGAGADFADTGAIAFEVTGAGIDFSMSLIQAQPSLTATNTDALLIDNDSDGSAGPGDTVRYTVTVSNADDAFDASIAGVAFASGVDANATLVVGSVTTSQGSVTSGNTGGDTTVGVDLGTITDGNALTITYDVLIDRPLNSAATSISAQGTVTATSLAGGLLTDDPAVGGATDPTNTPISQTIIGDFIWNDVNGNGVQDGGPEVGLGGVTLDAYHDANNNDLVDGGDLLLGTVTTDGAGAYSFGLPNLLNFVIDVTDTGAVLTGFTLTGGTDPVGVDLAVGGTNNNVDFGYQQQTASIGDFVWNDLDGDGTQDAGEPGLSGVTVYLDLNANGSLDGGEPSDTADGSGSYDLTNLGAGTYTVRVDAATLPAGLVQTTAGPPQVVNLAAGEDFNDADFGYVAAAAPVAIPVPTLTRWNLALLMLLLGLLSWRHVAAPSGKRWER